MVSIECEVSKQQQRLFKLNYHFVKNCCHLKCLGFSLQLLRKGDFFKLFLGFLFLYARKSKLIHDVNDKQTPVVYKCSLLSDRPNNCISPMMQSSN